MTKTLTTCDGCGKEVRAIGTSMASWVQVNMWLGNGMDKADLFPDKDFCPDCWNRMTEALGVKS